MSFMKGSQIRLGVGLVVGLAAFWAAAPPVSSVDSSTIGGWYQSDDYVAISTAGYHGRIYDHFEVQLCSWWSGAPSCYGGSIAVPVPSSTGWEIAPDGPNPCQGNSCTGPYQAKWK